MAAAAALRELATNIDDFHKSCTELEKACDRLSLACDNLSEKRQSYYKKNRRSMVWRRRVFIYVIIVLMEFAAVFALVALVLLLHDAKSKRWVLDSWNHVMDEASYIGFVLRQKLTR